ncbi:uncharacterized protein [Hemitrygon akajei]|uniref:uncharacterized protein n=1 Tax=Hemitrygon akajei TaxID=2704970 RepID=UPI003BFA0A72
MEWSGKSKMMTFCSCWLQVVLQVAVIETSANVLNGTVTGNIFLPVVTGITEQIQTVEWKYSNGISWSNVGKLILDAGNWSTFLFNYSHRASLYPNGSLSLRNMQMSDSGTYSCTVTGQNGEEFIQSTEVNVFRGDDFERTKTEDKEWSTEAKFNLSHHLKNNGTKGHTSANCVYIGILVGMAIGLLIIILVWAVLKCYKTRSSRQGERNKTEQSDGIRRSMNDDIYVKMGKVPDL